MKKIKRNFGFTLIELLVVIAIIGVLASVVLASVNTARMKARDARRLADVRQLVLVLQLYYDDNNAFPPSAACPATAVSALGWCCLGHGDAGRCWQGFVHGNTALDNSLVPRYIPIISDDPLNNISRYGDAYLYNSSFPTSIGTGPVLHWGIEKNNPTTQDCAGGDIGNWGAGQGIGSNYQCILPVR